MRWSAVFIAGCMTVTAGALGAAAYLVLDLSPGATGAAIIAVFAVLAAIGLALGRKREPETASRQVAELSRGTTDLARQVGEFGRRLIALETALAKQEERLTALVEQKAQAEIAPIASEIEVLGTLVKQLADSVAAHEVALLTSLARSAHSEPEPGPTRTAASASAAAPVVALEPVQPAGPQVDAEMLRKVRGALEANRVDLYLQPIVTLPQRKVRYYEAVTRLRTEEGGVLTPADYLAPAEIGGLMPMLDNLMLFRCVQVVRRMNARNRELALFCNIASATLLDGEFFPQFQDFLADNRAIASSLVFEFTQAAVRGMGPVERASLAQLASLGFRFSMDRVGDLQLDPRTLAEEGFRYVKIPAALLLDPQATGAVSIHASDLSNLMARYGIELIAERIESESTVVDLLDFDVRFGQGFLFAPPRPVRSEVFQGAAERTAAPTPGLPPSPGLPLARAADTKADKGHDVPASPNAAAERIPPGLLQLARNAAARRG